VYEKDMVKLDFIELSAMDGVNKLDVGSASGMVGFFKKHLIRIILIITLDNY
jgi:hypothetical protein